MSRLLNYFRSNRKNSADTAKERLQIIVAHQRSSRGTTPKDVNLQALQQKLIDASRRISKEGAQIVKVRSMEDAIYKAAGLARSGDVVLLSPGGTSFDAYSNYEERGEDFCEIVKQL